MPPPLQPSMPIITTTATYGVCTLRTCTSYKAQTPRPVNMCEKTKIRAVESGAWFSMPHIAMLGLCYCKGRHDNFPYSPARAGPQNQTTSTCLRDQGIQDATILLQMPSRVPVHHARAHCGVVCIETRRATSGHAFVYITIPGSNHLIL